MKHSFEFLPLNSREFLDRSRVGSKAYNLALLSRLHPGRVPHGISLTAPDVTALVRSSDQNKFRHKIGDALEHLLDLDRYYAVRSSSTLEDSEAHSFAGQFETYLALHGRDAIITGTDIS